jgi:putative addiction module antidote
MTGKVTVRKIGNSYGVIIPKADLDKLGVKEGDSLFMIHTPVGIRFTTNDPDFARVMDSSRDYMSRHPDALKELAE